MDSDFSDFELADHPLTRNGPNPTLSVDYLMEPSIPKAPTVPKALLRLRQREALSEDDRLPDYTAARRSLTTRPSMRKAEAAKVAEAAKSDARSVLPRSVLPAMSVGALSGLVVMLIALFFR